MEKLVGMGLVRAIGISNFTQKKLRSMLEDVTMTPAVHQGTILARYISLHTHTLSAQVCILRSQSVSGHAFCGSSEVAGQIKLQRARINKYLSQPDLLQDFSQHTIS